jgi:CubicO group peptidase (beta-lactamase class C family)
MEWSARSSPVQIQGDEQSQANEKADPGNEPVSNGLVLDTPENHGVDSAMLESLQTAIAEAEEPEVLAMVIVRDGAIIDEYYSQQYDEASLFYLASCTKTFMGALIGIAIDEGLIRGVDAKLSEYFPALADETDGKEEITLEHLLTHTSGIEWDEWNGGPMFHELQQAKNPVAFVLDQPMAAAPGSTFNYNSGGSHLLSAVLEKATGQSAFDFARAHLFEYLGMDSVNWPADPQGITDGSSSIEMTARDAAKFGQLYLNGGRWQDRQVISREWVEQSTSVQSAGTGGRTGRYGYQWWIRSFGNDNYDTFFAMGGGGHYIFVVPELALVVVMSCYNHGDSYAPWPYFTDYILPACE